ncbi:hypothetical protein QM004_11820 [Bacillus subtilis]|uniref:hypothetical protein n=1 Tax=Bacillus subtilis TaxID=1423 RepID=UPI0013622A5F|nr:hypothetical protein [Bacillus subtilis]QHJ97777.1 hypothetical protein C7M17_00858 [Bacillus subtilis]WIY63800.1 hypothetical protein QM004_11820 [Bacillus subtilis]
MGFGDEIAANTEKIKKTEGWRIYKKIEALHVSKYVFEKNHEELFQAIKLFLTDNYKIMNTQEKGLNPFLYEISRLLHNYLSSAKTLIDHTRKIYQEEYENTPFSKVYQNKIKETFTESPLAKFIQDLRNYSLHRNIPISGASIDFLNKEGKEVFLVKKNLLDWNGWTNKSKKYIETCKDDIDMIHLINDYTKKVKEFQEWFVIKQKEIHKEELDELIALERKGKQIKEKLIKKLEERFPKRN